MTAAAGRRITLVLVAAAGAAAIALVFAMPTSSAREPDRENCFGYPEPRIFLENQSWWEPQPGAATHPGTGKQGHIHVATCFPLYQRISGNTIRFDLKMQLHNMPGNAVYLRIDAYGDYHHEVSRSVYSDGNGWHCPTADCMKWVTVYFPLSKLQFRGWHEFNIFLIVFNRDPNGSDKQYNLSRWFAFVDNGKPDPPPGTVTKEIQAGKWVGVGGDSWHITSAGGKYSRVGMKRQDVPWNEKTGRLKALSGVWEPTVHFEKQSHFAYVDPAFHANPPRKGTIVYEGKSSTASYTTKKLRIDTRKLSDGLHRLVIGSANVRPDGANVGVGVIPFLVRANAARAKGRDG